VHYDCSTIKRVERLLPTTTRTLEITLPVRLPVVNLPGGSFLPTLARNVLHAGVIVLGSAWIHGNDPVSHVGNTHNNVRVSRTYTPPAQNHLNP
jgi:hypothetical protein